MREQDREWEYVIVIEEEEKSNLLITSLSVDFATVSLLMELSVYVSTRYWLPQFYD
jgi:hypothetical protein